MKKNLLSTLLIFLPVLGVGQFMSGCSDQSGSDPGQKTNTAKPATSPATAPTAAPTTSPATPSAPAEAKSPTLPAVSTARSVDYAILDTFEVGKDVYVRSLMVDKKRNTLWIGTSVGVHEIDLGNQSVRNTFTREQGLANEYVFAIGLDSEDHTWFGTNAGGASRYKDGQWKTFFPMHGLADYWIYSFASHPDGSLWIGTWAGVNRLDLKTMQFTTYVKELVNEWVYDIEVDAKARLWFGTEGGVSRYDGQTWHSWTHKDGLGAANLEQLTASPNTGLGTRSRHDLGVMQGGAPTYNPNYVFSLNIDAQDRVWAGTWGGGISLYDQDKWTNYTTQEGLPGNIIFSMARDNQGVLWVGTENGLGYWQDGHWRSFPQNHIFIGKSIYSLAIAPNGDLWVGTFEKVIRIGPKVG